MFSKQELVLVGIAICLGNENSLPATLSRYAAEVLLGNFPHQGTRAVKSVAVSGIKADPVLTTAPASQFEWFRQKEVGSLELANIYWFLLSCLLATVGRLMFF